MPPRRTSRGRRPKHPGVRLLRHDRELGCRFVAGADEAGRGCLAGPLVAAAVAFDYDWLSGPVAAGLRHLNDSKRLSPAERERLYDIVVGRAHAVSVGFVSPQTIDRVGLHRSNLRVLGQVINRLRCCIDVALVDGFRPPDMEMDCRRMVRGDSTSAAIAAASIVAKVARDRLMCRLDEQLDYRWAFSEHMGYATPLHRDRINEHGVSPYHRRSFDSSAYRDEMWSEGIGDVLHSLEDIGFVAVDDEYVEPVAADAAL